MDGYNPVPRDSHIAVIYGSSMFIYGGSSGVATSDFHELRLLQNNQLKWMPVRRDEDLAVSPKSSSDCYLSPQQSANSCTIFRGNSISSGGAMEDYLLWLSGQNMGQNSSNSNTEFPVAPPTVSLGSGNLIGTSRTGFLGMAQPPPPPPPPPPLITRQLPDADSLPGLRFCHVGCVYEDCLYVFGGYDGSVRLGDFIRFRFQPATMDGTITASTLMSDLRNMVNNEEMSDIVFVVEGIPIFAHKILCSRCEMLKVMLTGEMIEGRSREVVIPDVRHPIFLGLLEYLYTDTTTLTLENAMEMFQTADRFGVDRLKRLCENLMLSSLNIHNAAHILYAADLFNAKGLRERCLVFIVTYFNDVSRTVAFEEVGRSNIDLIFEILKRR